MRFQFPPTAPGTPTAEALTESPEYDLRAAEIVPATALPAMAVAAAEPSDFAAEPIATAERPQITPEDVPVSAEALAEAIPPQLPESELQSKPVIQQRPRPRRKVIAFPRHAAAPKAPEASHLLADPVLPEQPRILDVPEELEAHPATPFLDGLQFEPAARVPGAQHDHIELPSPAARFPQRIYAAVVDCFLVAVAAAVFALIGHKMAPTLALTKSVRLPAAMLPVLLWGIYQYLLLVYAGRTLGMQVAAIRMVTFKGLGPSLRQRRNRVLGLYFSTASLVMGLLWALVDADALCWHDRISGTYLTKRE